MGPIFRAVLTTCAAYFRTPFTLLLLHPCFDPGLDPCSGRCHSQEYYGDFVVMEPHHFCIPAPKNDILLGPQPGGRSPQE